MERKQDVDQVLGPVGRNDVDHPVGDLALGMHGAGRDHELGARHEFVADALGVEDVARSLKHIASHIGVVPVERSLGRALGHIRGRPEAELGDVGHHVAKVRKCVGENLQRSRFERHGSPSVGKRQGWQAFRLACAGIAPENQSAGEQIAFSRWHVGALSE